MEIRKFVTISCLLFITSTAIAAEDAKLTTPLDKASYAIGMDIAISLKRNSVEVNPDIVGKR